MLDVPDIGVPGAEPRGWWILSAEEMLSEFEVGYINPGKRFFLPVEFFLTFNRCRL